MAETHQDSEAAAAGRTGPDRSVSAATFRETETRDHPPAIAPAPITPPPDPDPGQRDQGCRFIAADVEWRRWRYCGKPIRRGAWCAAHAAACYRWHGLEDRQRRGEEIIRQLSGGDPIDLA